jgi:hypothetical protein
MFILTSYFCRLFGFHNMFDQCGSRFEGRPQHPVTSVSEIGNFGGVDELSEVAGLLLKLLKFFFH